MIGFNIKQSQYKAVHYFYIQNNSHAVKREFKGYAQSVDRDQPAQSASADLSRYFFAICQFFACPRTSLLHESFRSSTKSILRIYFYSDDSTSQQSSRAFFYQVINRFTLVMIWLEFGDGVEGRGFVRARTLPSTTFYLLYFLTTDILTRNTTYDLSHSNDPAFLQRRKICDAIAVASIFENCAGVDTSQNKCLSLKEFREFLEDYQEEHLDDSEIVALVRVR